MIALLLAGVGTMIGGRSGRVVHVLALAAVVGVGGVILTVASVLLWRHLLRIRRARTRIADAASRVSHLADLIGLGLTAGHNVSGALAAARQHIHPGLVPELDQMLRLARHRGVAPTLATASGHGSDLYRAIARSVATGASTLDAVTAFAGDHRAALQAAAIERARRLPVKLLFPLALLVLPGFTLVLLGPALVGAIERVGL